MKKCKNLFVFFICILLFSACKQETNGSNITISKTIDITTTTTAEGSITYIPNEKLPTTFPKSNPSEVNIPELTVDRQLNKENKNIEIFERDYLFSFEYDGEMGLAGPRQLEFTSEYIYLVDSGKNRIRIYDLDWKFIKNIETLSNGENLNNPTALAINSKQEIIVGDSNNNKIRIFDKDFNHLRDISVDAFNDSKIWIFKSIEVNSEDEIYFTTETYDGKNLGVYKLDEQDNIITLMKDKWADLFKLEDKLIVITLGYFDFDMNALKAMDNIIYDLTADDKLEFSRIMPDGYDPISIQVLDDKLYVLSFGYMELHCFDKDWNYLGISIDKFGDLFTSWPFEDMKIDVDGNLYVINKSDKDNKVVYKFVEDKD
jgi:hypothetical protein